MELVTQYRACNVELSLSHPFTYWRKLTLYQKRFRTLYEIIHSVCVANSPVHVRVCVSVAVYHYDNETLTNRQTEARLSDKTLCMIAVQGVDSSYRHYDVHSLYGASQTYPTLRSVNVDIHYHPRIRRRHVSSHICPSVCIALIVTALT